MVQSHHNLYFATSSGVKFNQYKVIFSDYGYNLIKAPAIINLIEPQLNDELGSEFELLVSHPLRLVARFVSKRKLIPYFIEDTLLIVKAFSNSKETKFGLPGADTKNWWNNLGTKGLLSLMENANDRSAEYISILGAYLGEKNYLFSEKKVLGTISKKELIDKVSEENIPYTNPYFFHSIFIPKGSSKTYAQMNKEEFKKYDYRRQNVKKFISELRKYHFQETLQLSFDFS